MIHPETDVVFINEQVGRGVRANRFIPRGTIVWALDRFDIALSPAEMDALDAPHRALAEKYGYLDAQGRRILCWDGGRFVNHSCRPASRGLGGDLQIAVRDIHPGEEITCDYSECNVDPALECHCYEPGCRKWVHAKDLLACAKEWDLEIAAAVADAGKVPQPLLDYVVDRAHTEALIHRRIPTPSIGTIYCASLSG